MNVKKLLNPPKYKFWLYLILAVSVMAAFFVSRLINLTLIPIFTDEAIYLRWAQIGLADPRWRFISLTDGKQPLLIWLFYPALKLISDPLIAGRIVSIVCGFFSLIGIAILGRILTKSNKGAVVGAILYLIIPFFLIYDRLAVYDALFGTITVWTLILIYFFATRLRLDLALLLGSAIGAGLLTKSYAYFFLILHPLTLILMPWQRKTWKYVFIKWVGLSLAMFIQSQIYFNIMRLSEFYYYLGMKNLQFLFSPKEFMANPMLNLWGNLQGLSSWLISYLTIPLFISILISIILFLKKDRRICLFFLSWFIIPFFGLAFFGKVIYPRFLLFMVFPLLMPLLIVVTDIWEKRKINLIYAAIVLIIICPLVYFDYQILFNPLKAPMPKADSQQLLNDWPSGYGIKEVIAYLDEESKKGSLVVGTDGTFGLFPMALELYLGKNPNVTIKAYWPLLEFPKDLQELAKTKSAFMIFKERQQPDPGWPLLLIKEYQRGNSSTYLKFYRVLPKT